MTDLKTCPNPWCKSADPPSVHIGIARTGADVHCLDCKIFSPWMPNEKDAIAAWNTRPAPTVKPLVWWSPSKGNNYTHGAETIFGTYYVGTDGGRHNAWIELFHEGRRPIEQWFGEGRGYIEAAKSDAQKHYESRILSTLQQHTHNGDSE